MPRKKNKKAAIVKSGRAQTKTLKANAGHLEDTADLQSRAKQHNEESTDEEQTQPPAKRLKTEKKPASSSPDPDSLSEDKPQKKADHSETAKVGPQTKTSAKGKKASTKSSASPVVKAFSVTISPSIHSKPDQPSKVKPAEISKASDSSSDDKPAKKQNETCVIGLRDNESDLVEMQKEIHNLRAQLSNQADKIKTLEISVKALQKEKDCRTIMYRLKDFDNFCNLADKIKNRQMQHLRYHERLFRDMLKNPRVTVRTSLLGLFDLHNADGHMSVENEGQVEDVRKLYEENKDIFNYYCIKRGDERDVYDLLKRTTDAIPVVQKYLKK